MRLSAVNIWAALTGILRRGGPGSAPRRGDNTVPYELATLALLVAGYALVARRLERFSVGAALAFLLMGIVLSDDVLGSISLEPEAEGVKLLAEATLTLLLFADASSIRVRALRSDARPVARLLIVGLLLTIALGTVVALVVFPGVPVGVALLIAATLAPTDAALGQAVVTNTSVPPRIRRLLSVESGLNDGIATPIVFLALTLATSEVTAGSGWLTGAFIDLGIGIATGILLGVIGGTLLVLADRRDWTSSVSRQLFVLSLAAACYLVAVAMGGNGFIAAFVGGLAFGRTTATKRRSLSASPRRRDPCWRSACGPRSAWPWPAIWSATGSTWRRSSMPS